MSQVDTVVDQDVNKSSCLPELNVHTNLSITGVTKSNWNYIRIKLVQNRGAAEIQVMIIFTKIENFCILENTPRRLGKH